MPFIEGVGLIALHGDGTNDIVLDHKGHPQPRLAVLFTCHQDFDRKIALLFLKVVDQEGLS